MFFKNKHVITSLIVAPILALISYFTVDNYISEVPQKAQSGETYKMAAKSNCRWQSGRCTITNGDFKVFIVSHNNTYSGTQILVSSKLNLKNVKFAIVNNKGDYSEPHNMSFDKVKNLWKSKNINVSNTDYLQLIILANDSIFYAEVPALFMHKEKVY